MRVLLLSLLLATAALSCRKSNSTTPDVIRTLNLPAGSTAVIASGNQFAMNFFNTVLQQDATSQNKLVSPFSIYMALGMLYNGSAGATRDSMALTLRQAGIPIDQLNAVNKALIQQLLTEDSRVNLSVANSLWYNQSGPQPLKNFLDTIDMEYKGHLQALDFANAGAINTINSWVATATHDKITSILSSLSPADVMVLANAIYFKGTWSFPVKTSATSNQPFTMPDGSTKSVQSMGFEAVLRTYKDPAFTLLELPYGAGTGFAMYVALPTDPQQPLAGLASSLDAATLASSLTKLDSVKMGVFLPKWELSYSVEDMLPNLAALGMGIATSNQADFSNMFPTPTHVSRAIHKTYINVNEQGTEAAAATAVVITTSAPNIPLIQVNRPFLYFIVEKQTGAILFMGTMNDPSLTN
jgi:serine protease inhibitor